MANFFILSENFRRCWLMYYARQESGKEKVRVCQSSIRYSRECCRGQDCRTKVSSCQRALSSQKKLSERDGIMGNKGGLTRLGGEIIGFLPRRTVLAYDKPKVGCYLSDKRPRSQKWRQKQRIIEGQRKAFRGKRSISSFDDCLGPSRNSLTGEHSIHWYSAYLFSFLYCKKYRVVGLSGKIICPL